MSKHTIKVTKEMFAAIKLLLEGGCSRVECAKYMKVSLWVVNNIANMESYEEYEQLRAERNLRQKRYYASAKANVSQDANPQEVKEEPVTQCESRQTVIVQASHYMLEEQKKTNELLTSISNKLAFIVEELTGKTEVHRDE